MTDTVTEQADTANYTSITTDSNVSLSHDPRTVDGKPLFISVTVMEPELCEKDGEKFMVYPLSTDVCKFQLIKSC